MGSMNSVAVYNEMHIFVTRHTDHGVSKTKHNTYEWDNNVWNLWNGFNWNAWRHTYNLPGWATRYALFDSRDQDFYYCIRDPLGENKVRCTGDPGLLQTQGLEGLGLANGIDFVGNDKGVLMVVDVVQGVRAFSIRRELDKIETAQS